MVRKFKERLESLVSEIENVIDEMPFKGNSCQESQKICLIQALNKFSFAINGIEKDDLEEIYDEE